ncbi:beta-glucosidase-related glycosidase [Ilyonectria destructans]|nr:beta-glucosidase-related glycosidase [Ilyonectria destructans]
MQGADSSYTFQKATQAIRDGENLSTVAQILLSQLTQAERLHLLDGDDAFYPGVRKILCDRYNREPFIHGAVPRLGIPGIRFTDGPRGVVMGASTAFPVSMARGATWDTLLERRIGDAIGLEAKAQGANFFAGVCVNLPRHPAWGRIQESYGEDPLLLGEFGLALTQGVQRHVMACVKHFALNSMENARFRVDVQVETNVLHEVYLPHFRRIIEGGVASVMSSYNSVNGEWAGQSKLLLTDILRHNWNFDGFVLSDFIFGLRDAALSLKNGLDIEAPFSQQRAIHLRTAIESGKISWADVDKACSNILAKELQFEILTGSTVPDVSVVFSARHRSLAREVAGRSMVLLRNKTIQGAPILPLNVKKLSRVAVVGRLANVANTGDKGSSQVFAPHVVTPFEGLRAALPNTEVLLEDTDSAEKAREVASHVDVVICIAGYDARDEGEYVVPSSQNDPGILDLLPPEKSAEDAETLKLLQGDSGGATGNAGIEVGAGGDRKSLRLRQRDVDIITAVAASNKKTVVSIVAAGPVILEEWKEQIPALIMAWYAGSEGGHGLADVLLGRVDASGRLPFSIPKDEAHLPYFDMNARKIQYDRWFGQSLLDKLGVEASFPFGFGLSYTNFEVTKIRLGKPDLSRDTETLTVWVSVRNTGPVKGRYIAQVYGRPGLDDFPTRMLLGFAPVDLNEGESKEVEILASTRPLQRWIDGKFVLPHMEVVIEVAAFSGDPHALQAICHF